MLKSQQPNEPKEVEMSKVKGWAILIGTFIFLWFFAVSLGPWLQHHIYGMEEIVQVIEEQDIDAGAYFYTEIEGSYSGEKYLTQALSMSAPDQFGLTLPFISGILLCLFILFLGWKYLPD